MIKNLELHDALSVARIHHRALAGDFLPSLGEKFLTSFYQGIIHKHEVFSFGFFDNNKIIGYVVGAKDIRQLFRLALKSKLTSLTFYLLLAVMRKPILIKKVLETFLYSQKDSGTKAELVVIAVIYKFQGKGIGKELVRKLEKAFLNEGVSRYKVTVHADKNAVNFYEHLKFNYISSFNLYDKMWYIYEKEIKKNSC